MEPFVKLLVLRQRKRIEIIRKWDARVRERLAVGDADGADRAEKFRDEEIDLLVCRDRN